MTYYRIREMSEDTIGYKILEVLSTGPKGSTEIASLVDAPELSVYREIDRCRKLKIIAVSGMATANGYLYKISQLQRDIDKLIKESKELF